MMSALTFGYLTISLCSYVDHRLQLKHELNAAKNNAWLAINIWKSQLLHQPNVDSVAEHELLRGPESCIRQATSGPK